jgi:hypothetical protein
MDKDTINGQMEENIGDSTKKTFFGGREYPRRMDYYTKSNMKKTSL